MGKEQNERMNCFLGVMAYKFNKKEKSVSATESPDFCNFHTVFQRHAGQLLNHMRATCISQLVDTWVQEDNGAGNPCYADPVTHSHLSPMGKRKRRILVSGEF